MAVHPRTSQIQDPDLPAVATLLAPLPPSPIRVAVATAGGEVADFETTAVTWWPGSRITVTYRVSIEGGELAGSHDFVATAGRVPEGALVLEGESGRVGVWRVPHDPVLPGLSAALDPVRTGRLLQELGVDGPRVAPSLRAYRPGRRAVVSVSGRRRDIYLKVLSSARRVRRLHSQHLHLADALPVPASLGYSEDLALIALQSMAGTTLRHALEDPAARLPAPGAITTLMTRLPAPSGDRVAQSPIERLPGLSKLLAAIVPDQAERITALVEAIGEDSEPATVPVHGDLYEAQIMVDGGRVGGMLDVDTYGWGRPGDDPATMLGHLYLWQQLSRQPERVREFTARLLEVWDCIYDPGDLRRRTAAVLLTLAPGAFRVQTADWPAETIARIGMAERWLDSALRVDKRGLTSVSGRSHVSSATSHSFGA